LLTKIKEHWRLASDREITDAPLFTSRDRPHGFAGSSQVSRGQESPKDLVETKAELRPAKREKERTIVEAEGIARATVIVSD
jgi:hypothetical protein